MQGLGGQVSAAYKDLCLFPDVQLPAGFKMPKFDLYDGHGDPVAHLRGCCSKMRGAGRKDELLMAYFSQNFEWCSIGVYNVEIVPGRLSLTKLEKKPSESFREYGFRWREQAARVNPSMEEAEMVEYFLQALEPTYIGHVISAIGNSFNEVMKMGGMVEEGLKSSKIMSYSAIKATTQAIQNGTGGVLGKKKKEDVAILSYAQPPPYPQWRAPASQNPYPPPQIYRNPTGPSFRPKPENRKEKLQRKQIFTPLGESYSSLFRKLRQLDVLKPIKSKLPNPPPRNLSPEAPNINQNPLPANAEKHMVEIVYKDGEPEKPLKFVMMIRASESNSVNTPIVTNATSLTTEGLMDKLSPPNVKPPVLVVKGLRDDFEAKQGKPKVVVPGAASNHVIIVEGARTGPIIIKPVTQLPINNTNAVPGKYKQVIVTYKGKEVEEEVNET
ncbi:PREDICTED: uncharacterized protein LOC109227844 [Nicotiana attenuata]|uniref:uncharacterized protein LOC109227844 n=1 Tax=Nicotiana attenuata TaxID=49451 RepID=UPI000904C81E|nr:PREDICTED: uncharacterized protein LOC109227844 [Nicotiana attenuata]